MFGFDDYFAEATQYAQPAADVCVEQPAAAVRDSFSADQQQISFEQREALGGLSSQEEESAAHAAVRKSEAARLSASGMMDTVDFGGEAQLSDGVARDGRTDLEG